MSILQDNTMEAAADWPNAATVVTAQGDWHRRCDDTVPRA
jgi:hypothetical protein